jgi:hypothetical protein
VHEHANANGVVAAADAAAKIGKPMTMSRHAYIKQQQQQLLLLRK